MSRTGRALAFAAIVGATGAIGARVAAQPAPPPLVLTWNAPSGCPSGPEVERAVARLLGNAAVAPDRRLTARADVTTEAKGYRLHVTTTRASGGPAGERTVEAPTCRAIGDAASVILALAIDPSRAAEVAAASQASASNPVAEDASSPVAPVAPAGSAARSAPPPADAGAPDASSATSAPTSTAKPDAEAPPPARSRDLPRFALGASAGIDSSSLPHPSLALTLGAAVRLGAVRLALDALYLPTSEAEVATSPSRGGRLWLLTGGLHGCYLAVDSTIELGPCVLGEAGILHGEGFGVRSSDSGGAAWLALGAGGFGALRVTRNFALRLGVDGVAPLVRTEFVVQALGQVHRPAPVIGRATAGVEVRF